MGGTKMKLRDLLEKDIESAKIRLSIIRGQADKTPPQLLDYEVDCERAYIITDIDLWVIYAVKSVDDARTLAAELMDLLGVTSAYKLNTSVKEYSIRIKLPNATVDIDVPKQDCHKAIVTQTQTIEFCGELDESKYDRVEYL
jgi:hypothetical protein